MMNTKYHTNLLCQHVEKNGPQNQNQTHSEEEEKEKEREREREKNDSAKFHNSAMPEDSYGHGLLFFS